MKKILLLSAAILCIGFYSCKKDTVSGPSMKATINGKAWSSVARFTTVNSSTIVITGNGSVTGFDDITLTVYGTKADTFHIITGGAATYKDATDTYTATSGTIIISNINTTSQEVSGSFNFVGTSFGTQKTVNVTNGTFSNLSYK